MIFAAIGHLLYGGVLLEWSTYGYAIMTAFDLIMGNYIFAQLETGLDPADAGGIFVAVFYFYLYFLLMMLVVMNIVISILMDGYNSVKERITSTVEEQVCRGLEPTTSASSGSHAAHAFGPCDGAAHDQRGQPRAALWADAP